MITPEKHRRRNTIAIAFIIVVVVVNTAFIAMMKHNLHDCQEVLFEHLYEMEAPKDIYER